MMTKKAQTETVALTVDGMTCNSCTARVRAALEAVAGVEAAEVTLRPGRALVQTSGDIRKDQLIAAVGAAGYRAAPGSTAELPVILPGGSCCS